jgi:NADH-quinone oxidoreductase subunit I
MIVKSIRESLGGMWSLLVGMKVTSKNFVMPHVTVHYPRQSVASLEGYRGHIELVAKDDDPFKSKCIACSNCVRICPNACITMKAVRPKKKDASSAESGAKTEVPAKKAKPELQSFVLDFNYCSLCGQCAESCPSGALRFSSDVYLAGFSRDEFVIDLMARLQHQAQKKGAVNG